MFNKEKPAQPISSEAVNQAEATEQEDGNSEKRKKALKRILTRSALMVGVINAALLGGAKFGNQISENSKAPASLNMESNTMDNVEEQDYYTAIQTPDDYAEPDLPAVPVEPDANGSTNSASDKRDYELPDAASYFEYNTPDNQGVDSSSSSGWRHIGESEMTSLNHEATVDAESGAIENDELTELKDAYIPPVPPAPFLSIFSLYLVHIVLWLLTLFYGHLAHIIISIICIINITNNLFNVDKMWTRSSSNLSFVYKDIILHID